MTFLKHLSQDKILASENKNIKILKNIWFEQRNGRFTVSDFHRVSTRLKTYAKEKCDTSCATSNILGYSQPSKEKTAYGYKN